MKWVFRILGALVLVVAVALGALLLMPSQRIAQIAASQIEAQTGRKLTISGGVKLSLWPVLGAETGPVTLSNAVWAGEEPMFRAESLSIGVGARELIAGQVRVTQIVAEGPVLNLQTGKGGRGNWEFAEPAGTTPGESGAAATPVTLEKLRLTDAQVRYAAAGADPLTLGPLDLTLDWPDPAGAADLTATLDHNGATLTMTGRVGAMAEFLAGKVVPVMAAAKLAGAELSFDGRASTAGEVAGSVRASSPDSAKLLAALGMAGVDLPQGFGRAAEVETQATYTADGRLALRDLALTLDRNEISGAADLDLSGARPQVTANLSAGALDVSALGGGGSAGGSAPAAQGWSRTPIDASALGLVDGTVTFSAQSIDTGVTRLGPTEAKLTLERARAVLQLAPATVFDGSLSGRLIANNRKGFSVAGNLSAENLDATVLLRDLAGIDRLSGKVQAQVEFLGSGSSVDAIMRSLSGKGSLKMGRGVIAGIDLDKLFRSGVVNGGTTVFDSLSASYTITGGNLQNDDLLLALSSFKVTGKGRVGLGVQDLDYLVTPVAFQSDSSAGLQVPVRITGPWSGPSIRPDLDAATKAKIEEQKDALEEKAKQKLKEKLNLQEGQDAEEAIKDRLEEEAKKSILKLLGAD